MAKDNLSNQGKDRQYTTENIEDVRKVQEKLKETKGYVKPPIPEGATKTKVTFTRDMALALVFVYRFYKFHPQAKEGQYYPKKDLFAEMKQNLGKEMTDKITRSFMRLKYWDCLVPMPTSPDEVIYKKGWWGITDNGIKFIQKDIGLPKYAYVYNDFAYDHEIVPLMITDLVPEKELKELLSL